MNPLREGSFYLWPPTSKLLISNPPIGYSVQSVFGCRCSNRYARMFLMNVDKFFSPARILEIITFRSTVRSQCKCHNENSRNSNN